MRLAGTTTDTPTVVRPFDVPERGARLSPLGFEHIDMLGRYAFTLPDTVARGELRPLRDPASANDEHDVPALTQLFRSGAP